MTRSEVYGVSCILRRLTVNFITDFISLPSSQLSLFTSSLTQLTCLSAHRSVQEEEVRHFIVGNRIYIAYRGYDFHGF